ncbi:MAG: VOC family protein [Nodosilinea sp.]
MSFVKGMHHVAIICGSYHRSKRFYTQVLGFAIVQETYRAERQSYKLDLRLEDGTQIELFSFPNPPLRPSRPEAQGLRHLALAVDDLESAIRHLHSHQVPTEAIRSDELTGKRFAFFSDPDQLPIELYER